MENNKVLYTAYTKLAVKVAVLKGLSVKKAKKEVLKQFKEHPFEKLIINAIDNDTFNKKSLNKLVKKCLEICQDCGPDREYVTFVSILESINKIETKHTVEEDKTTGLIIHFKETINHINKGIPSPPLYNMLLESRLAVEWGTMIGLYHIIPKLKKGQGKPVLLMPPYLGNDYTTRYMRKYLKSVGFKTYKWELGVNSLNSKYLPKLIERLEEIYQKHQEKVSLVGWSGGGIFAKVIANRYPDKVEQLVTIGSPVWGVRYMKTPLVKFLEFFRGRSLQERNGKILRELEKIPPVPVTCIYTKTDGLVPWKNCLEAETLRADINNIEVFGSHCGMGANASVLVAVANSLIKNSNGEQPSELVANIERIFYPKFWKRNTIDIVKGLLLFNN